MVSIPGHAFLMDDKKFKNSQEIIRTLLFNILNQPPFGCTRAACHLRNDRNEKTGGETPSPRDCPWPWSELARLLTLGQLNILSLYPIWHSKSRCFWPHRRSKTSNLIEWILNVLTGPLHPRSDIKVQMVSFWDVISADQLWSQEKERKFQKGRRSKYSK